MPELKRSLVELVAPEGYTRDGSQLEMFITRQLELPWSGQSARVLTKSFQKFRLGPPPPWGLRE